MTPRERRGSRTCRLGAPSTDEPHHVGIVSCRARLLPVRWPGLVLALAGGSSLAGGCTPTCRRSRPRSSPWCSAYWSATRPWRRTAAGLRGPVGGSSARAWCCSVSGSPSARCSPPRPGAAGRRRARRRNHLRRHVTPRPQDGVVARVLAAGRHGVVDLRCVGHRRRRGAARRRRGRGGGLLVAMVTLCGSLAIVVLPVLAGLIGVPDAVFGAWSGASVHDVGQVVATASSSW